MQVKQGVNTSFTPVSRLSPLPASTALTSFTSYIVLLPLIVVGKECCLREHHGKCRCSTCLTSWLCSRFL